MNGTRSGVDREPGSRRTWPRPGLTQAGVLLAAIVLAGCSGATATGSASTATPVVSASASASVSDVLHPQGRILFLRTSGNDQHAYFTANADGTGEEQVSGPGEYCCVDRISPDRSRILVMPGGTPPSPVTGGTIARGGDDFQALELTDQTLNLVPEAWSPDGSRFAFEGWNDADPTRTGIYTGTIGRVTELVRLTSTSGAPHDVALDFSPDGRMLVFYRAVRGEPDFPIDIGGSLWVVNTDGSAARELDTPPPNWWARWSPDGSTILFASERNQATGAIWTIRADGTGLTKVFDDADGGFPIDPIWSPDGTQIMFMLDPVADRFTHPNNILYVMRADGTGLTTLIDTPDFKSSPEWWLP